jgi:UDP-N-acetylglucosamine transferase subunit ALG13
VRQVNDQLMDNHQMELAGQVHSNIIVWASLFCDTATMAGANYRLHHGRNCLRWLFIPTFLRLKHLHSPPIGGACG